MCALCRSDTGLTGSSGFSGSTGLPSSSSGGAGISSYGAGGALGTSGSGGFSGASGLPASGGSAGASTHLPSDLGATHNPSKEDFREVAEDAAILGARACRARASTFCCACLTHTLPPLPRTAQRVGLGESQPGSAVTAVGTGRGPSMDFVAGSGSLAAQEETIAPVVPVHVVLESEAGTLGAAGGGMSADEKMRLAREKLAEAGTDARDAGKHRTMPRESPSPAHAGSRLAWLRS